MEKIAIVGASGYIGSHISEEFTCREHVVTANARRPDRIAVLPGHIGEEGRHPFKGRTMPYPVGYDAVVTAVPFAVGDFDLPIGSVRASRAGRDLVVRDSGVQYVRPKIARLDRQDFPETADEEASKAKVFPDKLKEVCDVDWTFVSPSEKILAGERTGVCYTAWEALPTDDAGGSWISDEKDPAKLVARVRRLQGQLDAVVRALEADTPCGDVLQLFASIRSAVNGLTVELIEDHVRHHVVDPNAETDPDKAGGAADLPAVLRTYLK